MRIVRVLQALAILSSCAAATGSHAACPDVTPERTALAAAGFAGVCESDEAIREAIWRFRLTIGSPGEGAISAEEIAILQDHAQRARQREALKLDLQKDEVKRQLIATGALDSDVENATLAVLREAVSTFRRANGFTATGALTDAEKEELKRVKAEMDVFAGFKAIDYPGGRTQIVLPANLVAGIPKDENKYWNAYQAANGSEIAVHYFANPVKAYTANAMATLLLSKRRSLYLEHLSITGDAFTIEGSAMERDDASDTERNNRQLFFANGREQNGELFGVYVRTNVKPPAIPAPALKVSAIAPAVPRPAEFPETPEERNWRVVMKSITNLMSSEFGRLNGRVSLPIFNCKGVRRDPQTNRKIVNIVYATDREYLRPTGSDRTLGNMFGSEASLAMSIGCLQIAVPDTEKAQTSQKLPELAARGESSAGDYTYVIPAADPVRIESAKKERYYFSPDERANLRTADKSLLFIHGYNNDFEEAIKRAAQIASAADYKGFVYVFSWPSQSGMMRYASDMDYAEQAEIDLIQFIRMILSTGVETQLDVVAHSMGSQILLRTFDAIRPLFDRRFGDKNESKVRFGQVVFAAPDVSEHVFRRKVFQLRQFADRVTVYASANDGALDFSGWLRGVARVGYVNAWGQPVKVEGIDIIDITLGKPIPRYVVTRYLTSNHSAFALNDEVLRDIRDILQQKSVRRRFFSEARAGKPSRFSPGDCDEARNGGKISWWRLQRKDDAPSECAPKTVNASQVP